MQVPVSGQAYVHPSQDVNNQRCVNFFATSGGDDGRGQVVLIPTPGLKTLIDLGGQSVRGLILYDSTIFAVADASFYELTINTVTQSATSTLRGTLSSTAGPVSMARNGSQIIIADTANNGYIYSPNTTTFGEITDPEFYGATSIVFIDNYFFFNVPGTDDVYATAIGDGSSVSALDIVSAEAAPDPVVGVGSDKRELWVFGTKSIQIYYNSANATGFPFSLRDGAHIDIGCSAAGSIRGANNALYWLDDRRYVVRNVGYEVEIVSTEAINSAISEYSIVSDAIAFSYSELGHTFYVISFPTAKKTWVFDISTEGWHELAYWSVTNEFEHHLASCYATVGGWHIVGDRRSGKVYRLSRDYHDDAGTLIRRLRSTPFLHSGFAEVEISALELLCEVGKGTLTGTGSDPQISLRYSNDGGYTWSSEISRSLGTMGQYGKRVRWNRLGSAREWQLEFVVHDPVPVAIIDAEINPE